MLKPLIPHGILSPHYAISAKRDFRQTPIWRISIPFPRVTYNYLLSVETHGMCISMHTRYTLEAYAPHLTTRTTLQDRFAFLAIFATVSSAFVGISSSRKNPYK